MIGVIVEVAVSNVILSAALAVLAYAVHRRSRPALAHLLWVAVLLKVVTPPLVLMPVVVVPTPAAVGTQTGPAIGSAFPAAMDPSGSTLLESMIAAVVQDVASSLVLVWVVGSVLVLAVSLTRIRRFERLLRRTSAPAPPPVMRVAGALAASLGLPSVPTILLSRARVSPLTWWMGGRVRIVIPSDLAERADPHALRWILAHELAHVRRRDHLVRWLEWIACVSFWWNPIVWWARRRLRDAEEASCDALVLERLEGPARSYARALLAVVELLSRPAMAPLAPATGIGAGDQLERRFRAIISGREARTAPRWLLASLLVSTVASLSVGVGIERSAGRGPDVNTPGWVDIAQDRPETYDADADQGAETMALISAPLASIGRTKRARSEGSGARRRWDDIFVGSDGPDTYPGTRGRDLANGRDGPDDLSGRGGRDRIQGGPDRDVLAGGRADDVVVSWRDGVSDSVDCGAGDGDRAVVDPSDIVTGCEIVERRDPST